MDTTELFGEFVALVDVQNLSSGRGCDDSHCPGYEDANQCNPDAG